MKRMNILIQIAVLSIIFGLVTPVGASVNPVIMDAIEYTAPLYKAGAGSDIEVFVNALVKDPENRENQTLAQRIVWAFRVSEKEGYVTAHASAQAYLHGGRIVQYKKRFRASYEIFNNAIESMAPVFGNMDSDFDISNTLGSDSDISKLVTGFRNKPINELNQIFAQYITEAFELSEQEGTIATQASAQAYLYGGSIAQYEEPLRASYEVLNSAIEYMTPVFGNMDSNPDISNTLGSESDISKLISAFRNDLINERNQILAQHIIWAFEVSKGEGYITAHASAQAYLYGGSIAQYEEPFRASYDVFNRAIGYMAPIFGSDLNSGSDISKLILAFRNDPTNKLNQILAQHIVWDVEYSRKFVWAPDTGEEDGYITAHAAAQVYLHGGTIAQNKEPFLASYDIFNNAIEYMGPLFDDIDSGSDISKLVIAFRNDPINERNQTLAQHIIWAFEVSEKEGYITAHASAQAYLHGGSIAQYAESFRALYDMAYDDIFISAVEYITPLLEAVGPDSELSQLVTALRSDPTNEQYKTFAQYIFSAFETSEEGTGEEEGETSEEGNEKEGYIAAQASARAYLYGGTIEQYEVPLRATYEAFFSDVDIALENAAYNLGNLTLGLKESLPKNAWLYEQRAEQIRDLYLAHGIVMQSAIYLLAQYQPSRNDIVEAFNDYAYIRGEDITGIRHDRAYVQHLALVAEADELCAATNEWDCFFGVRLQPKYSGWDFFWGTTMNPELNGWNDFWYCDTSGNGFDVAKCTISAFTGAAIIVLAAMAIFIIIAAVVVGPAFAGGGAAAGAGAGGIGGVARGGAGAGAGTGANVLIGAGRLTPSLSLALVRSAGSAIVRQLAQGATSTLARSNQIYASLVRSTSSLRRGASGGWMRGRSLSSSNRDGLNYTDTYSYTAYRTAPTPPPRTTPSPSGSGGMWPGL